jgi:F420-dependent oxidoreductase-like protein
MTWGSPRRPSALGFDSVWTAEAYGSDVVSPLAWMGAHTSRIKLGTGLMQLSARTPACAAMTAVTLDHLTDGRLILGLGVSGPQVVEGWYGQPFPKPLARTREYVQILRDVWAREAPVVNDGPHYPLPYPGGTGLGKPLKITPTRAAPTSRSTSGPRGRRTSRWPPRSPTGGCRSSLARAVRHEMYAESLAGAPPDFDICAPVQVVVHDDVDQALLAVKWMLGFYIGGMGARRPTSTRT